MTVHLFVEMGYWNMERNVTILLIRISLYVRMIVQDPKMDSCAIRKSLGSPAFVSLKMYFLEEDYNQTTV